MLPVVYTLLADIILRHQLSWPLVLVGGTALFGGYLTAAVAAYLF
jgi:ClpP class serine protease